MPPRTTPSDKALGDAIKARRLELGLTIEDAAFRAGVGTKTWVRYESGSAIRTDKVHGICKALRWAALGGGDEARTETYDLTSTKSRSHGQMKCANATAERPLCLLLQEVRSCSITRLQI